MSTTYQIGCVTCKEHMWVAQTGHVKDQHEETYLYVYNGDAKTMNLLATFLQKHMCKSFPYSDSEPEHVLIFGESELFWDHDDWREINTESDIYEYVKDDC